MALNFSDPISETKLSAADSIEEPGPRAEFHDAVATVRFMLGGKAIVTFQSEKTGTHFTYRIRGRGAKGSPVSHFVAVLTRPEHYEYLGCIFHEKVYGHGRKSKIGPEAKSAVAFAWVWSKLSAGHMPVSLEVYHEGRCGRCGRRLTTPRSCESGIGPECEKKMGGGA